jgi:hypothetical protein
LREKRFMDIVTNRLAAARKPRAAVGFAALMLGLAGCGGDQGSDVPLVPALGKVTLDGKPLADANLVFIPIGSTKGGGGNAKTTAEGSYSVATPLGEPGLPVGEYKVVISKMELANGAVPPTSSDKPLPGGTKDEQLSPTYADRDGTILRATVAAGEGKPIDFELKPGKRNSEVRRATRVATGAR